MDTSFIKCSIQNLIDNNFITHDENLAPIVFERLRLIRDLYVEHNIELKCASSVTSSKMSKKRIYIKQELRGKSKFKPLGHQGHSISCDSHGSKRKITEMSTSSS